MKREDSPRHAPDGATLFMRRWMPDGDAKATVCVVHGICEHSGRYDRVAEFLTSAGYVVSAFDLRGHGRSSGARGETRIAQAMDDIHSLVEEGRGLVPSGKVFLYGQSLGGLLCLHYALERSPDIAGVVVSAPVLHTALSKQRLKVLLARSIGRLIPSLAVRPGLVDTNLMRDDAVLEDRRRDPLVHDRLTAGTGRDVLDAAARVLRDARRLSLPLLVIHGRADAVNFLSGSEALITTINREDATLRTYDDVKHHPHNDPERKRIYSDVVAWLDRH